MKILSLLFITATSMSLLACSSPEDQARSTIADFCEAFKNNDVETLRTLSTDPNLVSFPFWTDSDRKKASCGEKIKTVSKEKYIFILGDRPMPIPIIVENIDDEFMITGVNM